VRAIGALGGDIEGCLATEIRDTALVSPREGPDMWFHGDVRPGSLLLSDGRLRAVIDFGIAGVGDPACDTAIARSVAAQPGMVYSSARDAR
jgi:aminoglycoside phosphotransferase (APT) family kinase protein